MNSEKTAVLQANSTENDLVFFNVPVELKAATTDGEGQAGPPTFEANVYSGGVMTPRVDGKPVTVVVDLAGVSIPDKPIPVLRDHDPARIVGHATAKIVAGSLVAVGTISGTGNDAKEVVANAKNGFPWQLSMGTEISKREFIAAGATHNINGRSLSGPYVAVRAGRLKEISFLSLGADESTSARIAAQYAQGASMNFEKWLEAMGFKLADLSDAQRTNLEAKYNAEQAATTASTATATANAAQTMSASANGNDLNKLLDEQRKKDERRTKIVDLTAKALQDSPGQLGIIEAMSKQAMEGDWDATRYELELLRATRPQSVVRNRSTDDGLKGEIIEAALCMAGGLEKPEDHFSEQTLEAASKRFSHGLGLVETLQLFARRSGHEVIGSRNVNQLLRAAFAQDERSMLTASVSQSTLSPPGIFAAVANKFLRRGYDSVESTWRAIAAVRSVSNFYEITSYSLTGDFVYEELPPGGQLKHATVGEESYTNQAKTYGRMFGIDRRDIINDNLGALTQVPQRLGRGGALKFNLVFWTKFMDNAAFFTTARNNYYEGATAGTDDTRLNIEGLTRAETAFFNQTDPDGNPLGAMPRVMLIPNALNTTGSALMNSTEIRNTTANTEAPISNPHAGKFSIVRSSYLSTATITGYSTTAWYLLSDPSDIPVIEAVFLNGNESPTVESADADFNTLGIQMRGYHDFGVEKQEYRGGVKMKGAA